MRCYAPFAIAVMLGVFTWEAALYTRYCRAEEPLGASGETSTNSEELEQNGLVEGLLQERLRDRLFQSYRSGQDSLDGIPMPPQSPGLSPGDVRKLRERMSRSHRWQMNNDDITEPGEDGAAGENSTWSRDPLTLLKRQYETKERTAAATNQFNGVQNELFNSSSENGNISAFQNNRELNKADGIRVGADTSVAGQALKNLIGVSSEGFGGSGPAGIGSFDTYKLSSTSITDTRARLAEQRNSDFLKLLGGSSGAGNLGNSALNPTRELAYGGMVAADVGVRESQPLAIPQMPTLPGYTPSLTPATSLSPAVTAPAMPQYQPAAPTTPFFREPAGPPRRHF